MKVYSQLLLLCMTQAEAHKLTHNNRFIKDDMDKEISLAILGGKKIDHHHCDTVVHTTQHQLVDSDYSGEANPSPTIIKHDPIKEYKVV